MALCPMHSASIDITGQSPTRISPPITTRHRVSAMMSLGLIAMVMASMLVIGGDVAVVHVGAQDPDYDYGSYGYGDYDYGYESTPTKKPTTKKPTTKKPTTKAPTTLSPTTPRPTTALPTQRPTTLSPTTATPTTARPTTASPTTLRPTTASPTIRPTTLAPVPATPTTPSPTTLRPTTSSPTTANPTTPRPTTLSPTTRNPTTTGPTTLEPTSRPTTGSPTRTPTTPKPTTHSPTLNPLSESKSPTTGTPTRRPTPHPSAKPTVLSQLDLYIMADFSYSVQRSALDCYFKTGKICWSNVVDYVKDMVQMYENAIPYSATNLNTADQIGLRVYLSTFANTCNDNTIPAFVALDVTNDAAKVSSAIETMYTAALHRACSTTAIDRATKSIAKNKRRNKALVMISDGRSIILTQVKSMIQSAVDAGAKLVFIGTGDVNINKFQNMLSDAGLGTAEITNSVIDAGPISQLSLSGNNAFQTVVSGYSG